MRGWAQRRCKAPHEAETRRQPSKSRGCVKEQTQTRQSRLWRWLRRVPCGWRRRGALQQQLLQKGFASRAYWECCLEQTARRFCARRALIPRSHTRSSKKRRQQQRRRQAAAKQQASVAPRSSSAPASEAQFSAVQYYWKCPSKTTAAPSRAASDPSPTARRTMPRKQAPTALAMAEL